jgi:hypothetical protein
MLIQSLNERDLCASGLPIEEGLNTVVDDGLCMLEGIFSGLDALLHPRAEVIHRIQKGIGEAAYFRLDIAWHSQIDKKDGPVAALLEGGLDHPKAQDGKAARCAAHHHIELVQVLRKLGQGECPSSVLARQGLASGDRAIGNGEGFGLTRCEMRQTELNHFAGSNEQHLRLAEISEDSLSELNSSGRHRDRVGTDLRAGSDLFCNRERTLEEVVKVCAEATSLLGLAGSLLELAKDLRLS